MTGDKKPVDGIDLIDRNDLIDGRERAEADEAAHSNDESIALDVARNGLRVTWFDSVTSLFSALIIFLGSMVTLLVLLWFTGRLSFPPKLIGPFVERSGTQNAPGFERDFEPPGADEIEEIIEHSLPDSIEALTEAASTVAASLVSTDAPTTTTYSPNQSGDSRPPGQDHEGVNRRVIPRFQRWQIDFAARDRKSYATQLDYFQIELGIIGGAVQGVDFVFDLVEGPETRRLTDTTSEDRLYFMWTGASPLKQFDQQLIQLAEVPLKDRYVLRFIPKELENSLAMIELEYAGRRGHSSVETIAKTVFRCVPDGNEFRFEVASQRYRKRPNDQ